MQNKLISFFLIYHNVLNIQNVVACTPDQSKEQSQNIQVQSKEPFVIEEPLSIDGQVPLKDGPNDKKKTSKATEAVEKAFVAQRTSIERSSPPSFKDEVNSLFTNFYT